ncbi:hypothetical protein PoB_002916400 [Plakobranchus ocellatus]|uniref:Uncharacterized protein n=1 Tax=Plakobranchus ocellatus TaxID=259542 RepID=A0AAV4A4P7_9GAST|nr:hypothetical protein PoB_002916400 [Plakobranchus ocellatus]
MILASCYSTSGYTQEENGEEGGEWRARQERRRRQRQLDLQRARGEISRRHSDRGLKGKGKCFVGVCTQVQNKVISGFQSHGHSKALVVGLELATEESLQISGLRKESGRRGMRRREMEEEESVKTEGSLERE